MPDNTKLLTIPNILTALRILLIAAFVIGYFICPIGSVWPLVMFAAAGLTDFFDGFLARKLNQITWLGKLLDPLADKLMIVAVLYCYTASGLINVWLVALVVIKELYMITGSTILFFRKKVVSADFFGKAATALFIPAAVLMYPFQAAAWVLPIAGRAMLYFAVVLSMISAIHYTQCILRDEKAS